MYMLPGHRLSRYLVRIPLTTAAPQNALLPPVPNLTILSAAPVLAIAHTHTSQVWPMPRNRAALRIPLEEIHERQFPEM